MTKSIKKTGLWVGGLAVACGLSWLFAKFDLPGLIAGLGLLGSILLGLKMVQEPRLGLWLVLFFLPFERIPSVDVAGVTFRLNFLFGGLALATSLIVYASGRLKSQPNPIFWPLATLILGAILSSLGAFEVDRSLIVVIFLIFTSGIGLLAVHLIRTQVDLSLAMKIIWWSALVVGLFGIFQFLGDVVGLPTALTGLDEGYVKEVLGFPRVQAFSIEPLYLGNYLLLPLSLLAATVLLKVKQFPRGFLWLLFGLLSLILVLTVSRGAYLGAIASVLVIMASLPRETFRPTVVLVGLVLLGVVGFGSYYFINQARPDAIDEFVEHALIGDISQGESTQGRLSAFGKAYDLWQERPVLGVGPGNFGAATKDYPDPRTIEGYDIVNNQYLELLAEYGLVGFLAFCWLIWTVLSRAVVASRVARDPLVKAALVGTTAALVGLLVQYNFFSTIYIIHIWIFIGLAVASQNVALARNDDSN